MTIYRGAGGSIPSEAESTIIPVSQGGTGATTIAEARTNLNAAKSGINSDITQLLGLEVPLSVAQGGTGANNAEQARTSLGAASSAQGAKADTALQPADVATVATSGSYNDLTDKPTVPDTLDSLTDVTITSATADQVLKYDGSVWINASPTSGTGDVVGPASATDGAVALFDGTTGKLLKNGVVLGSAATTSSSAYATAAQGAKADSAVQTETDPVYVASSWYSTTNSSSNWNTAYGWGNHASAGYLTTSTAASTYAPLTGTGTSGTWSIDISGNAATATNMAYSGLTGTVPTWNQNTTGSAATLTTGRTVAITGDLAYTSGSFDGSGNVTGTGTLATVNSNVGAFGSSTAIPVVTVNAKGLVTSISTATVAGGQYFGSAATKAIAYNSQSIAENVTVTTGNSGISAGPITISSGYTVTVQSGSRWVIV